jgi:hypothetical protein
MTRTCTCLLLTIFLLAACAKKQELITLSTDHLDLQLNQSGRLTALTDPASGRNYLVSDSTNALLSLRKQGRWLLPQSATIDQAVITLTYPDQLVATVQVTEHDSHITFDLVAFNQPDSADLVAWGPYHTSIGHTIGETVGVVRDSAYALGIQSLNLKTLGGYPWNESDRMPAFDIFRQEDPTDMHPEADGSVLYRVEAAKPTPAGSSLQAYCRNRSTERIVQDFNHDQLVAPAYDDGGVIGSRIALFGSPVDQALDHLGRIEQTENLPHPMIDGVWGKRASNANAAYLITTFTEETVEASIALTKRAGLRHMYHYGNMFETWGHFIWNEAEFPNGAEGLRTCVQKAEAEGIKVGTHFLSNFITTDDPYVTPVPDVGLALVGSSVLTRGISATDTEIPIQTPDFFNQMKNNNLKTVRIGDELIRYGKVSESAPWTLLDCQRGAWGTTAITHDAGTEIGKLLDHGYKVFLTDVSLTRAMSERMAEIYNQTGLRQISFDGLEGNRSTGLGAYGESMMPYLWYEALDDRLRDHLIIDASRTTHFFWHIFTRMNWGEPWYAGFRESQTEYRFNNQAYFQRNYIPGMLGWFKMTPETSVADVNWLLAKAAGYEAGYALVTDPDIVAANGHSDQILDLIGDWEQLRLGKVFTAAQRERLRDTEREFELQPSGKNAWTLTEINSQSFAHQPRELQPGQPTHSTFELNNEGEAQPLQFVLTAVQSDFSDITFEIDQYKQITLPAALQRGQILQHHGDGTLHIFSESWQKIREFRVPELADALDGGTHQLTVDATFSNRGDDPVLKVETRFVTGSEGVRLE